ncbi:MAG: ribose 5-phosphate isomerase B [Phycisphaerae bacterium]
MRIVIASDHRGYVAKDNVRAYLKENGHAVEDLGCSSQASCDYPDHGFAAAEAVACGKAERGILFCGTGIGMSIAANKVDGVRAALCHDELTAELARRHNQANVLCLPADLLGVELMKRVVEVWLNTEFEGGRHKRRISKISHYEKNGRSLS